MSWREASASGIQRARFDFDPHGGRNVVDFSRYVTEQVETDDLENALAVSPLRT